MWQSINLLASVFGLAALLSYDIIWWAVLQSGGVLHYDPTFGWFETWVEPVLLAIFTVVAVVGLTRHIRLVATGTSSSITGTAPRHFTINTAPSSEGDGLSPPGTRSGQSRNP